MAAYRLELPHGSELTSAIDGYRLVNIAKVTDTTYHLIKRGVANAAKIRFCEGSAFCEKDFTGYGREW